MGNTCKYEFRIVASAERFPKRNVFPRASRYRVAKLGCERLGLGNAR